LLVPQRSRPRWSNLGHLESQDAAALSQACEAWRKSEAIAEKTIGDIAKLGRAMSVAMVALGVSLGPRMPETLIEEVGCLPGVVREHELSTARRAVHRVLAMIECTTKGWTAWR
jgi:hypothetical protein